ncbi:MAG: uroporphyrinogen-III C-methyltransferase [Enterobacterales bacterium]|nr:uroporphyrinogen-III C-methyltransferase [Enterobacterales bacterium]
MTDDNKTDNDSKPSNLDDQDKALDMAATVVAPSTASQSDESDQPNTAEHSNPADLFDAKPIPKMPAKKSKKGWFLPSLIALLLIVALLVSSWVAYQQWIFQNSWDQVQSDIQQQVKAQNTQVAAANSLSQKSLQAINQTQIQLNQLSAKIQQSDQMLLSTQERVKALSGRQKQDWMLAEVAHLIKLAQLQLTLQKDKDTAVQLLKTADNRLIEISDNSLLPVRQAIAQDLSDLSLIMQSDVTGIAMSLSAITKAIEGLTLSAIQIKAEVPKPPVENEMPQQEGFDLHQLYQNFLKDFVVIKDYSEPVKPLITPEMRQNLISNIQLALQQAQIALLQSRETLYRKHINDSINWIGEYYVKDDKTKNILTRLNQLKTTPVDVRYPNQLKAQKALQIIAQQQLYRWLESAVSNSPNLVPSSLDKSLGNKDQAKALEQTSHAKKPSSESTTKHEADIPSETSAGNNSDEQESEPEAKP